MTGPGAPERSTGPCRFSGPVPGAVSRLGRVALLDRRPPLRAPGPEPKGRPQGPATSTSTAVAGGCRPPGRTELTMTTTEQYVSVRYIVDDVAAAVDFYTTRLGFSVGTSAMPAFADVRRGRLRLLLSG